jgi:hypothetical protein
MVCGARDESPALVWLADAMAGFLRDAKEGQAEWQARLIGGMGALLNRAATNLIKSCRTDGCGFSNFKNALPIIEVLQADF